MNFEIGHDAKNFCIAPKMSGLGRAMMAAMDIDTGLCGGSIVVVDAQHPTRAELALRSDNASEIRQWFYFRARAELGQDTTIRILNAGGSTYGNAWDGYRALASYDLEHWFRLRTEFDGDTLTFHHRPQHANVYYAYFAAYPLQRHAFFLQRLARSPRATVTPIGHSLEGRPLELVQIGREDRSLRKIWIIARQHPGETMAEWFIEGLLERLVDEHDALAAALLARASVYVVPNMNPDGSTRGNFRTNAAGRDLNRAWFEPELETSPEVLCARNALHERGVDLFLDVHGDEHAPCAFTMGCEGNPSFSRRQAELERRFIDDLATRDHEMRRDYDYGPDDPGKGDLSIANNYVGEAFDCLSLVLEMPFKDGVQAFSPQSARRLGRVALESIYDSLGDLR